MGTPIYVRRELSFLWFDLIQTALKEYTEQNFGFKLDDMAQNFTVLVAYIVLLQLLSLTIIMTSFLPILRRSLLKYVYNI
jgi:hypothetical protein